jgi:hypothetical protein
MADAVVALNLIKYERRNPRLQERRARVMNVYEYLLVVTLLVMMYITKK